MTNLAEKYDWLPPPPPRKFKLLPGEKAVMRARPEQTCSQWAHGNRYVAVGAMPGPYDLDVTPYARGLLDAFSLEYVRELFLCGGSQSAKTDIMHTCWGYAQETEPDQALIVMQDRDTGSETINDRLIPMVHNTPTLRKLRTKNPDDIAHRRIRLRNGAVTYLAWSNSEGRLASKPMRYGFADEVDLWPESAITRFRARFRTYESLRMSKIIEACTASTAAGRIWLAQKQVQAIWDFYAVCPACGHAQTFKFGQVRWPESIIDPADLAEKGIAWYECEGCGCRWDEDDRDEAVIFGAQVHDPPHSFHGWCPREGSVRSPRPSKIWAHIPPLTSRFVDFHKVAAAYLEMQLRPTPANTVYFWNDCLGLPVPEDADGDLPRETELYKTRRETYAPEGADWAVPLAACVLTADVDVQSNRLECEVVAWGPGDECWGLQYKSFHGDPLKDDPLSSDTGVWAQLHNFLQNERFRHESGVDLRIVAAGVDIGFAARRVAKFVSRDRRRYIAHKGSNNPADPFVPRKPSKSKHGVAFYLLGVAEGKDTLFAWLASADGAGRLHFPQHYDFEWFRMLCAEHPVREKDRRTGKMVSVWKLRDGYTRNEALDIRVGNMAVREILNPNYEAVAERLAKQADEKHKIDEACRHQPADETRAQKENSSARTRPSWFRR